MLIYLKLKVFLTEVQFYKFFLHFFYKREAPRQIWTPLKQFGGRVPSYFLSTLLIRVATNVMKKTIAYELQLLHNYCK